MALPQFIYGGTTGIKNPEELARARALAEALLGPQRPAQNVGEGLAVLGQAIRGRREMNAANAASTAGSDSAQSAIAKALGGAGAFPAAPSLGGASNGPTDYHGDQLAWTDAAPYQKAFLNTLAGPESGGRYDVMYGGGKFSDFSRHPNQANRIQTGPNAGRTSSAAGKYQFLGSTWDQEAKDLGLSDFSPVNQDKAAWGLASKVYKQQTGGDLATVLQSGDPAQIANVGKALSGTWTSLPSGIEQGTTTDRFVATYQRALGAGATPAQATQVAQQETQKDPVQVASLDPSAGLSTMAPGTTARGYDPSGLPPLDPNDPMAPASQPRRAAPSPVSAALALPQQAPVPQGRPSIAAALSGPQAGQPAASTPAGQRVVQQMINPQPMSGGAPLPMMGMPPQAQAQQPTPPPAPPQQVAQNQPNLDQIPVIAGGNAGAVQKGQMPSIQQLMEASQNPWLNDEQRGLVNMLMKRQMDASDPNNQLDAEYKRAQIDALKAKPDQTPESVRALNIRAQQAGLVPGTKEYQEFMISGGSKGTNINVDTGTIPQGLQAVRDDQGRIIRYEPIPGGPADTSKIDAAAAENRTSSSDVITGASDKIRDLAKNPSATGLTGALMSNLANTDAAEVYRQVDVLKSNATIANLNAMRAASKTGGALGSVSDKENDMLAAKAGALDPKSPHFQSQLDDYERNLLRIVHGKEEGDRIFDASRKPDAQTGDAPQPGAVEDGYRFKGGDPADQSNWEPVQ